MIGEHLTWPAAGCCDAGNYPDSAFVGCVCSPMERALRAWKRDDPFVMPMTEEQREYCLAEIDKVEGHSRQDFDGIADQAELARGVLDAWTDYCRDKGLL